MVYSQPRDGAVHLITVTLNIILCGDFPSATAKQSIGCPLCSADLFNTSHGTITQYCTMKLLYLFVNGLQPPGQTFGVFGMNKEGLGGQECVFVLCEGSTVCEYW